MVVMMVKVLRRKAFPGQFPHDDKAYWIKPPYTKVEERIFDEWWDKPEKWPRRYPEDWYLTANEGTPEAIRWQYGLMGATRLTFGGGAPHRPNSLDPAQPALAPDQRSARKEPAQ